MSTPEKRDPYVACAEEQVVQPTRKHLQLSPGNKKKIIYCYKTLPFSDGTSF